MSCRKSANELSAELQRLRGVVDHIGMYVFTKDADGRYTYANQAACDLVGRTLEQIIGKTDEQLFDLEWSNTLRETDERVIRQGEHVSREEEVRFAGSDEVRVFWSEKRPLYDEAERIVGLSGVAADITERKRLEQASIQHKELLDTVLNNVDAYIYMKDVGAHYLYANRNTAELLGVNQDELIGSSDHELFSPELIARFSELDREVFEQGIKARGEETFVRPDGEVRHFWSIKIPLTNEAGNPAYVGISTDITEVIRLRDKYEKLAHFDSLTGLLSRGHLLERADDELKRAHRKLEPMTVLIADVDHFKEINDSLGHAAGDKALVAVAGVLQNTVREMDFLGRLGGDEFALVAPDTGEDDAEQVAQRLMAAVEALDLAELGLPSNMNITLSIGLAVYEPQESLDELFARADRALYRVKQGGRNGYETG